MSPNLTLSTAVLNLASYQPLPDKDAALGYAGLDADVLLDPVQMLPGFTAASNGSFWVKNSSALVAQSGSTFDSGGLEAGGIHVGKIGATVFYGIDQTVVNRPLYLHASSGSQRIYVYNGQTIGAGDSANTSYLWSIGPDGTFSLKGGAFGGSVSLGGYAITNALSVTGATLSVNFVTGAISSSGSMALTGGVTVPDAKTGASDDRPVNRDTGDTLYGMRDSINTWSGTQTFSVQPVFTVPLSESQVSGLTADLAAKLPKTGGTMSGAIAMGSNKITGLGNPTAGSQEAATAYYTDSLTIASTGGILSDLTAVAPLARAFSANTTSLSMPVATSIQSGYLSFTDWARFDTASAATSAQVANTIQAGPITGANAIPTFRAMVRADLVPFLSATSTQTIGSVSAQSKVDSSAIAVVGAALSDPVILGLPETSPAGVVFNAFVSTAGNVTIRATNVTGSPVVVPSGLYTVTVLH